MHIRIQWSTGETTATLEDTPSSRKLFSALPFLSSANTWGEEVYFSAPINVDLEPNARQVVLPGTVCFWVEGYSVAIPYGATPISRGDECRLITAVNILGKLDEDPAILATIGDGDPINVYEES